MFERIKIYFRKRQKLAEWKEEKRMKWLSEGRTEAEVRKALRLHKIKF